MRRKPFLLAALAAGVLAIGALPTMAWAHPPGTYGYSSGYYAPYSYGYSYYKPYYGYRSYNYYGGY